MSFLRRLKAWLARPEPERRGADAPEGEELTEPGATDDQPLELPIEDSIDLHTFAPAETASVVEEYLLQAHAKGFREVRIIHGKGRGVQRRIVRGVLGRHPLVRSFADAPPHRGGYGATIAWLGEA